MARWSTEGALWPTIFLLSPTGFSNKRNFFNFDLVIFSSRFLLRMLPPKTPTWPVYPANFRQVFASMAETVQGEFCLFCFELIKSARHAFHFHFKQVAKFSPLFVWNKKNSKRQWCTQRFARPGVLENDDTQRSCVNKGSFRKKPVGMLKAQK